MKSARKPVPALLLVSVAAALALSGCADKRGGPIPYDVSTFGVPDSPKLVPLEAGYRIAPMDTLTVKVFKMPDLPGDYEVDLAGHISMPLIGEIAAYDMTTALDPLLMGCSDDRSVVRHPPSHRQQGDEIEAGNEQRRERGACRVETEQHGQHKQGDQGRADRLQALHHQVMGQMIDLLQRRHHVAGMARDMEQVRLVEQPMLRLDH